MYTITLAPFGYKKNGTPRTRRAPGTGSRYKGSSKKSKSTLTPTVSASHIQPTASVAASQRTIKKPQLGRQVICPVPGCNTNFTHTKDPQNSVLVHVRYKAGKECTEHQHALEKMKNARKTDPKILKKRKNARQREYRAANVERVEQGKKLSRGRVKARKILNEKGEELDDEVIEKMAEKYVRNL